jgi:hypothetical protein
MSDCECKEGKVAGNVISFAIICSGLFIPGKGVLRGLLGFVIAHALGSCNCKNSCSCEYQPVPPSGPNGNGDSGSWSRASDVTWSLPPVDPLVIDLNRDGQQI